MIEIIPILYINIICINSPQLIRHNPTVIAAVATASKKHRECYSWFCPIPSNNLCDIGLDELESQTVDRRFANDSLDLQGLGNWFCVKNNVWLHKRLCKFMNK